MADRTDRLDELVTSIQQHVRDRKSELKALETQIVALRSAHEDLHGEVENAQRQLQVARNLMAESDNELARRRDEAQKIANDILRSAHAEKARAETSAKATIDTAAKGEAEAFKRMKELERVIDARKAELQGTINAINAKKSEFGALQAAARRFADG